MSKLPKSRTVCSLLVSGLLLLVSWTACANQPQKFLVFDGAITPSWIKAHGNEYVFVWGASPGTVPVFQQYAPHTLLGTYFPHMRDPNRADTLAHWQATHPTWVLYQCDGRKPALLSGDSNITLDTNNPEVIQWQIQNFLNGAASTHAVALDGLQFRNNGQGCGVYRTNHSFAPLYSGKAVDRTYADDVANWVQQVYPSLHKQGIKVIVNHIPDETSNGRYPAPDVNFPPTQRLIASVDGMVEEGASFTMQNRAVALGVLQYADYVAAKQKWMYFIYELNPFNVQTVESAMASYLMMASPYSAVFVSNRDSTYGHAPNFLGYDKNLGNPCGAHTSSNGILTRQYEKGIAMFALPEQTPRPVAIPAGYQNVDGNSAPSQIVLNAGEGSVLYRSSGTSCSGAP